MKRSRIATIRHIAGRVGIFIIIAGIVSSFLHGNNAAGVWAIVALIYALGYLMHTVK